MCVIELHYSIQKPASQVIGLVPSAMIVAPRKGLDLCSSTVRSIDPMAQEEVLREEVCQFCVEACRHLFAQVKVLSCQELNPEAVCLIHPPERCWFLRMAVSRHEDALAEDEVQGIVSISDGALHLLLR